MNCRLLTVVVLVALPLIGGAPAAQAQLSTFGVLGGSTVRNTATPTIVNGDLGVSPGSSITGFPPGTVVGGSIHAADAVAGQAQTELAALYNNLGSMACNTDLTGQDLGGLTLLPGVYCFSTSAQLTGTLTLDAQGDPNATFVFQIGSTLTTASGASVLLINNAPSCGVFWKVGSSATLGTTTNFAGSIVALSSITLNTGAGVTGRVLARNGAVTLDDSHVTTCSGSPGLPLGPAAIPTLAHEAMFGLAALLALFGLAALRARAN
jgi:Ice-binding-like